MNVLDYKPKDRKRRFKKSLKTETKKAVHALIITLSSMIVALTIAFIALTNSTAQKGYSLEQTKLRNEELKNLSEDLKSNIVNSNSSIKIEEKEQLDHMKPVEEKTYVTEEDNKV